ncbi:MAG: HlyD family efflux transporter periplasmic adaptor subunit [Acaryochloridaceae cyanobacterium RL_2_7]|nr:HlyD family efflux transporter periplasmic adaptor subunit [Acaryochloridaceae cyanobacterium RL_2_7]
MSSLKWGVGITLAMLLGVGAYAVNQSLHSQKVVSQESLETIDSQSDLSNQISALGRITPEGEIFRVGGPSGARIEELKVREGQMVQKGSPIAILDTYKIRKAELEVAANQVLEAQSMLESEGDLALIQAQEAETRLLQSNLPKEQEMRSQEALIAKLKAELQQAKAEVERYRVLVEKGAAAQQILETRQLTMTQKQNDLAQANATLQQLSDEYQTTQKNIEAQIKSIQAASNRSQSQVQLESALSRLELADVMLGQSIIRAPFSGQIIKVHLRNGESIEPPMGAGSAGQTIVEMGRTQQMYVIAEVYETDIKDLKPGLNATIESDAISG